MSNYIDSNDLRYRLVSIYRQVHTLCNYRYNDLSTENSLEFIRLQLFDLITTTVPVLNSLTTKPKNEKDGDTNDQNYM